MQLFVAAIAAAVVLGTWDGRVAIHLDPADPVPPGEPVRVRVELSEPSHLLLLRVDTEGRVRVIFPAQPWDDATFAAGAGLAPGRPDGGSAFIADDATGTGYLLAIASKSALDLEPMTAGSAWNLEAVGAGRMDGDPYEALSLIAARIAPAGAYDYDIAPYHVGKRHEYPRFVCYACHRGAAAGWDAYTEACERFTLVVHDDPAHYPYREYPGRAVTQRPVLLPAKFEFRDRAVGAPGVIHERREPGQAARRADARATPPSDGAGPERDSVLPRRERPRSLSAPELRRRKP